MKRCAHCNAQFEPARPTMKYCCGSCRLNHWKQRNPDKFKQQQLDSRMRLQQPKHCKGCGTEIIRVKTGSRVSNRLYCDDCISKNKAESDKKVRARRYVVFESYKKQFGCFHCGWNGFACALDFHHFQCTKNTEINASTWTSEDVLQYEYDKCVLLCKNCHYGVHHGHVKLDTTGTIPPYAATARAAKQQLSGEV